MNEQTEPDTALVLTPVAQMGKAHNVASACKEIVSKETVSIQGKAYIKCQGWQAIAIAHGCFAGAEDAKREHDSQNEHIGYSAKGYVRNSNGQVISTGEGFVGFDETDRNGNFTWKGRAEYAGRAMAQTRAISRACRSAFAHVAVMMGYEATPAEEVPAEGFNPTPKDVKKPSTAPQSAKEGQSGGSWREHFVHLPFGDMQDRALGTLSPKDLAYLYDKWMPKKTADKKYPPNQKDKELMAALIAMKSDMDRRQEERAIDQREPDEKMLEADAF